ncbi:MAG: DEAD/DEAH box helicase, partial [Phaeodactylibacter sp.]|nr:DEAD/DEAH box helicase [Phaeodactylibacter sp.]
PGRLIDLIKRKAVKLDQLRFLVLDEADEMMNMGFKEEVDEILAYTPAEKMTWLFSATMPPPIKKVVRKYMHQPVEIRVSEGQQVNGNIEHLFANVRARDKRAALMRFLDLHEDMKGVVFCRTRRETQDLAEALLRDNFKADALHGDLSQPQRDRVMSRFKSHELQVLIATDVAARGIDVDDLTHVFHFSLPDDLSYYTHRSGRTARAGKSGVSIVFLDSREQHRIHRLERELGIAFKRTTVPQVEDIAAKKVRSWCLNVLESKVKGKLDPKLLDQANLLFANLTKEELTAKLLASELERLQLSDAGDLNDLPKKTHPPKKKFKHGKPQAATTHKPKNFKKRRKPPKKSKQKQ